MTSIHLIDNARSVLPPANRPPSPGESARMQAALRNLPALPAVVLELLQLLGEDGVSPQRLGLAMAGDAALTLSTLRLANSSFYGVQRQIQTVSEAVSVLGLRAVGGLVTTAALSTAFPNSGNAHFSAAHFWRHALYSAVAARTLAESVGLDSETAFTLGLLHDIGQYALASALPEHWNALKGELDAGQQAWHRSNAEVLSAERRHFGCDHTSVGARLMVQWKLAPLFAETIAQHHSVGIPMASQPDMPASTRFAALLQIADAVAHASGSDDAPAGTPAADPPVASAEPRLHPLHEDAARLLRLQPSECLALRDTIHQQAEALCTALLA
jgi:putative nucleotidyltransferase with HDIG domain